MSNIPTPPFFSQANCGCGGVLVLFNHDADMNMIWKCGMCGTERVSPNTTRGAKAKADFQKHLRSSDTML